MMPPVKVLPGEGLITSKGNLSTKECAGSIGKKTAIKAYIKKIIVFLYIPHLFLDYVN